MQSKEILESTFTEFGYDDFKWIDPQEIVVSQWVRMKCMFGCDEYGQCATCPPNVPLVSECDKFFKEYDKAVVFHFSTTVEKPEDRHAWTRKINTSLLKLEREVFINGHPKAFILFMDSCTLCKDCTGTRQDCKHPTKARPTPESMGVDVFATVRKIDYPIDVLSDYSQTMNRYAFLMIE